MYIDQIRLTRFKLFKELTLSPKSITLLTGANSSGKSTVLNSLAAITQTGRPHSYPFDFVANGTNCSLGSYGDIATGHDLSQSFGIGICATLANEHISLDASYRYSSLGDHISLDSMQFKTNKDNLAVDWLGANKGYKITLSAQSMREIQSNVEYRNFIDAMERFLSRAAKEQEKSAHSKGRNNLKRKLLEPPSRRTAYYIKDDIPSRDIPDKIEEYPAGSFIQQHLRAFVNEFLRTVGYVGPVRAAPLRYYAPDRPHLSVDPSGFNCAHLLHHWHKHDKKRFSELCGLLDQLELVKRLSPKAGKDEILKMMVTPHKHKENANMADVGFGVSQALPIIAADVALPDASVLLVNQPEVHLHPTAQAQLANYFVGRIKQRQYIIETHSEYIINRLRLLVQQGVVPSEKIVIIFFGSGRNKDKSPDKYHIQIQSDGSLKGAPREFFQTYYSDSFQLAMGPIKK